MSVVDSLTCALDELSEGGLDEGQRRPVFVDESGRRGRLLVRAGYAVAAAGVVYVGMLGVSLTGGPVEPGTLLDLPRAPGQVIEEIEDAVERVTSDEPEKPRSASRLPQLDRENTLRSVTVAPRSASLGAAAPTPRGATKSSTLPVGGRAPAPGQSATPLSSPSSVPPPSQPTPTDPTASAPQPTPTDPTASAPQPTPTDPTAEPPAVGPAVPSGNPATALEN